MWLNVELCHYDLLDAHTLNIYKPFLSRSLIQKLPPIRILPLSGIGHPCMQEVQGGVSAAHLHISPTFWF